MTIDNKFIFTKKSLNAIPYELKKNQKSYYDLSTPGLILRVGEVYKTFYIQGRVKGGEAVRVSIGKYPTVSIDEARELAVVIQGKLNAGINPNKERISVIQDEENALKAEEEKATKQKSKDSETLEWLFNTYINEHLINKKGSRSSTLDDLEGAKKYFSEKTIQTLKKKTDDNGKVIDGVWELDKQVVLPNWLDRPYRSITHEEVLNRFKLLAVSAPSRKMPVLKPVERTHQLNFRYLRAVYNYIIPKASYKESDDLIKNPVEVISIFKLWEDPKVRTRQLDIEDVSFYKWLKALFNYDYSNGVIRDYLLFSLMQTGRSIDVCKLKWENIDFKKEEIFYFKTKNGDDYTFPMTKAVKTLLLNRHKIKSSEWVFELKGTKYGHVPRNVKHHFKMLYEQSDVKISHHDLRRTWSTATMKLDEKISDKVLDFCLKHTIAGANKHYFIPEKKVLQQALQQVETYLIDRYNTYSLESNPKTVKEE